MESIKKASFKKVMIVLVSILFMGISLSVLNVVDYGMDSFTYMNLSIADKFGWKFGNWQIVFNILLFIPVIIWERNQIGIGTVLNMVLIGYTVDFCMWIWNMVNMAGLLENIIVKIIVMLMAVAVFIIAAAIYMAEDLGTSPVDALPIMFCERFPNISFRVVRTLWDLSAVTIGFILSRKIGIVTILMVLFLGQTVQLVRDKMIKEKE